jgi:hypothetical protein
MRLENATHLQLPRREYSHDRELHVALVHYRLRTFAKRVATLDIDIVPTTSPTRSIVELPVLVFSKERDTNRRQGIDLEQPQSFLEGVVDVDLAARSHNDNSTSPIARQSQSCSR